MSDLDRRAPYGSWPSAITADLVAEDAIGLVQPRLDGRDLYWIEARPEEDGRQVIVRRNGRGTVSDLLPDGYNARTRVHEYGGGDLCVHEGTVWFSNFADQRLYRIDGDGDPRPITPEPDEPAALRYADAVATPDGTHLVCIRESHTGDDVTNELVAVPADGDGDPVVLASGRDFYAYPRLDPDGSRLVWLEWDHPNMPWDGTELREATFADGPELTDVRSVAGGEDESIFQPQYDPTGRLHFVSDRTGWWNLYREIDGDLEALYPSSAEFGLPLWQLGSSTYAFLDDGRIVASRFEDGADRMFILDTEGRRAEPVDLSHTSLSYIVAGDDHIVFVGASPWEPPALLEFEVQTETETPIRYATDEFIEPSLISTPESIEFPTGDGGTAHAVFYPPTNPEVDPPEDERPPLIVEIHGGPTAHRGSGFDISDQFWTSRGFGLVEVNYRGSTGYGREYRESLRGQWGVLDVEDAIAAARFLVERGDADPDRLIIRGGSAGGFTTLLALTTDDTFAAGASYFGVADVRSLVEHTHKFESRYIDGLMDPSVMEERSALTHVEGLSAPVILFQGAEDEVVPPEQSEVIVEALREKELPHAYLRFEGERHGFRRSGTIRRCLEAELSFYGQVFGFQPADDVDPVKVENL